MQVQQMVYSKDDSFRKTNYTIENSVDRYSDRMACLNYLITEIRYVWGYITLQKLLNLVKLKISYGVSVFFRRPLQWGLPASIAIEPTSVCNLACPECPSGNGSLIRRRGNISWSLFTKCVNELKNHLLSATLYFQGEPFLNPHIFEMIAYLKRMRIYSITSTNAQFLSPKNCDKLVKSGLNRIIVSLDGTDQKSYAKYRIGGSYSKVIEGIQNLVAAKKSQRKKQPVIYLQFLVFRHNEHQVKEVKQLGRQLGVDKVSIKAPQVYDPEQNNNMLTSIPKYTRYQKNENGQYQLKGKLKNKCWRSWQNPVITVDGALLPCCFDKDARYTYGNIKNSDIQQMWTSKNAIQFKKTILKNRSQFDICRNCTEGIKYMH
ncbi:MAG: radical SAM protein [Bacteroidetes bacterium]|jgi:radical SAM protein with 4Fe4S-binding SPASM domain|nr:radical SAM protein [Bacteroidota bacterium]